MSVYDPLGLVNHFRITGIIILQRTWIAGIGWDEELTPDIYAAWKLWLGKFKEIHLVQVPRCYHPDLLIRSIIRQVEVHAFVDASQEALSIVTYLSPIEEAYHTKVELQGCVLGMRFAVLLRSELPEEEWPKEAKGKDLGTILATRMLKLGDDSRVSQSSDVECGRESGKLIRKISQRLLPEKKFETFAVIERCVMVVWKAAKLWRDKTQRKRSRLHRPLTRLLNLEDFSSLNRLVCLAAAVQKAARFWHKKTFHKSGELNPPWKAAMENNKVRQHSFTVSPEECRSAVTTLVRWVQTESFPREIAELTKSRIVKKAKIALLSPYLINGTICLKSHILQANKVPAEQKTPAILPSDHHVMELLIQAKHERCAYQGSETLLNNLCGRFWIIDERQTGFTSDSRDGPTPTLQTCRLPVPIHIHWAFGPFTVTVRRRHEKRWVIIFTCLVTRAIHLEVVHALSTDYFIMGLSRFIDTHGRPDTIYSDNGTNFVGEMMAASGRFGPAKWKFNPPAAPHFGGAWERLIKSVKKCLHATFNEVNPKDTTLLTALKSAENIINSRPLTMLVPPFRS
ncbi:hypothetical protein LAZ67_5002944 [Cordylochernes scorpioides]|uniref:Integrase catalytic domain-containing protein n=1 Tax=Cordylochernes scorpioides TaxID=51811 RepID=A0ABY6KI05_9ARAC|nr:hypothetical protein LAZ67_5002944 [Cordylochernes scorpioides]